MRKEDVIQTVREVISDSCGIEIGNIKNDSTLFGELNVTSIDMVDILYTLEMEYDVSLRISDIEKNARESLEGKNFETDGIVTQEGKEILKLQFPEIPVEKLEGNISVNDIISLISVESLAKMVIFKIEQSE